MPNEWTIVHSSSFPQGDSREWRTPASATELQHMIETSAPEDLRMLPENFQLLPEEVQSGTDQWVILSEPADTWTLTADLSDSDQWTTEAAPTDTWTIVSDPT